MSGFVVSRLRQQEWIRDADTVEDRPGASDSSSGHDRTLHTLFVGDFLEGRMTQIDP